MTEKDYSWMINSGKCPTPGFTKVEVVLRSGEVKVGRAMDFEWVHSGWFLTHEVVKYRIPEEPEQIAAQPLPSPRVIDCAHGVPLMLHCGACAADQPAEPPPSGTKHDQGKPRMELIDSYAMEQLAEVLTFGAKKYAAHDWRKGIAYSRLIAACLRHIFAWIGGQDNDPESGLSHLAHAMCCIMFILGLSNVSSEHDDRYKPSSKEKTNG